MWFGNEWNDIKVQVGRRPSVQDEELTCWVRGLYEHHNGQEILDSEATMHGYISIVSQSADNSSILSSPTSSSSAVTTLMSLSQMYPSKLHTPRHISAHVDRTERWLQM